MADLLEGPPLRVPMFDPEEEVRGSLIQVPWRKQLTAKWQRWYSRITQVVIVLGTRTQSGAGSPNGVVTASPGCIYLRTDGGAGTTLYVKESGVNTDTGWVAK